MATLYVENVPDDLYEAIRERARGNRKSIAAEVLSLLADSYPTPAELARRSAIAQTASRLRARRSPAAGPFPTAEEMQREDRGR